jgi:hypothetical protein
MHRDVQFFTNLCVRERLYLVACGLGDLEKSVAESKPDCTLESISYTERIRLYRILIDMQLTATCFSMTAQSRRKKRSGPISSCEQFHIFLCRLPAWQFEELSFENDYINDKILQKWQETEDNLYAALITDDMSDWEVDQKPSESRWESELVFCTQPKSNGTRNCKNISPLLASRTCARYSPHRVIPCCTTCGSTYFICPVTSFLRLWMRSLSLSTSHRRIERAREGYCKRSKSSVFFGKFFWQAEWSMNPGFFKRIKYLSLTQCLSIMLIDSSPAEVAKSMLLKLHQRQLYQEDSVEDRMR